VPPEADVVGLSRKAIVKVVDTPLGKRPFRGTGIQRGRRAEVCQLKFWMLSGLSSFVDGLGDLMDPAGGRSPIAQ